MFLKLLDIFRIILITAGFFFGYYQGFADPDGYNAIRQIHLMCPLIIFAIGGTSGIEGLFFGKQAAEAKGFEAGSNYQRQSAFAMLSFALMSLLVYYLNWGIEAELSLLLTFMLFLSFSAINHAWQAYKERNYKWLNINRPFIILVLIAGLAYPVVMAIKDL